MAPDHIIHTVVLAPARIFPDAFLDGAKKGEFDDIC